MPLYEYQCDNCGEVFEVMQKFADEPLTTHEKCGGGVHRLLSAPALQFKGSGWYITDYAKSSPSQNGGAKTEKSSEKTGSETSTDAGAKASDSAKPAATKSDSK
ncbi:MAG: zinc ribbon domain-containing protein [Acidobacteriaceae bacterium]|nr:zinc ribbon domain-containing protein [Acidobacteriaceae bacterium]